jgi:segregation and condensation protein B
MSDNSVNISSARNLARVEALLFVASTPITAMQIADVLSIPVSEVEQIVTNLQLEYLDGRGLSIQSYSGRYQLCTSAEFAQDVEKFLGIEIISRLTRPSVETLAIVAYRQPITRPAIDAIRGVSSDGVIKSLLTKGLIQEVGRADGPGRPILFSTTSDFLQHFGLNSLEQLPPFEVQQISDERVKNNLLKD